MLNALRAIRFLIHCVPIKYLLIKIYQVFRVKAVSGKTTFSNEITGYKEVVASLNSNGFSIGLPINKDAANKILIRYPNDIAATYRNAHLNDKDIFDLATSHYLIGVAYQYLGFEPYIRSCVVVVDVPGSKKTTSEAENFFHYDIAGIKSLNVFIYLTDVCDESMPHVAIRGSHKNKRFRNLITGELSFTDAEELYGDKIIYLIGGSGTVYFENTEVFHRKGLPRSKGRVMINLLYTHYFSPLI